jgi:hypothetical protein
MQDAWDLACLARMQTLRMTDDDPLPLRIVTFCSAAHSVTKYAEPVYRNADEPVHNVLHEYKRYTSPVAGWCYLREKGIDRHTNTSQSSRIEDCESTNLNICKSHLYNCGAVVLRFGTSDRKIYGWVMTKVTRRTSGEINDHSSVHFQQFTTQKDGNIF